MRHCTTLAFVLSLSACEHASPAMQPATPEPAPPPSVSPAPVTQREAPAIEATKPLSKVPCRARVCPEWKTDPTLVADPQPPAVELRREPVMGGRFGISRAATPWRGEKLKVRIQQKPAAEPEAAP